MEDLLFQGKYRIPTVRASWGCYDSGVYFVTVCTARREHYFGDIVGGEMVLSEMGWCAQQCWCDISVHFPHVEVPAVAVMPNHVHGIVVIHGLADKVARQNKFVAQSKNLASVIRGFKVGVTKYARRRNIPFGWQSRFYDRIVRNQYELNRIAEYIENNVAKWDYDEMNENAKFACLP